MQLGRIQHILNTFDEAFAALHIRVPPAELEALAVMIHLSMTAQARHFHTLEHVFSFVNPDNPVQSLAALFHDLVYYQVDMGFAPGIWELIAPYVRERDGSFFAAETMPPADWQLGIALEVFDFQPGQRLAPESGLNEFLSALVMNKKLGHLLPQKILFQTTACIEATIPFRSRTCDGENHFDVLAQRLAAINTRRQLALTPEALEATVKLAVMFSNKDVENFSEPDSGKFLDNTWKLLPETNVALRARNAYSIREYRQALQKTEGFLTVLNPDNVFGCYNGAPPDAVFRKLVRRAHRNIGIAREYLRLKLLAMAILEALAAITGGDAPVSLFMGDVPEARRRIQRLDDFLPEIEMPAWGDRSSAVYKLLKTGRVSHSSFDMKNSPLSLFLYKSLEPERIQAALGRAKEMFAGRLSAQNFLDELDGSVVTTIARASANMATTRRAALVHWAAAHGS